MIEIKNKNKPLDHSAVERFYLSVFAVVAALFAAFAGFFAKKFANHAPAAFVIFAGVVMQSLERMQTLFELGAFEVQLIFLDEAAVDGVSVYNDTLALVLSEFFADDLALAQLDKVGGLAAAQTVSDFDHAQLDVVARHTAADDMRVLDAQLFEDVPLSGRRGGCRKCTNDRRRREALYEVADPEVVFAKAGPLLADAMRLVDHGACKVGLAECRLYLAVLQHLGCDEQEQQCALLDAREDRFSLGRGLQAIQAGGGNTFVLQLAHLIHFERKPNCSGVISEASGAIRESYWAVSRTMSSAMANRR